MLKSLLKLDGAQKLTKNEQKSISGGTKVEPANCACFCYSQGVKVNHYCFSYCPDGTIPGLKDGSTGDCSFPGGGSVEP
jgi:hypothetical protein